MCTHEAPYPLSYIMTLWVTHPSHQHHHLIILPSLQRCEAMSRKSNKVDLKLNLSPPTYMGEPSRRARDEEEDISPQSSSSSLSSCVLSDASSPEATSMVLAACPRCLMYVMLAKEEAKCPKCGSGVILDFLGSTGTGTGAKKTRKNQ